MCGIIGVFEDPRCSKTLLAGMKPIQNRGKDGYGIANQSTCQEFSRLPVRQFPFSEKSGVGHCLHSVVNYCRQPIQGKGILVANCEIYNWKELSRQHGLLAASDSELLFQLLEQTPLSEIPSVLQQLDGDFAFAYWRNQTVYLYRDPVGVKPLWYAKDKKRFAFASEAKGLYAMGFEAAIELHPRHGLKYDQKTGHFKTKHWFVYPIKSGKETNPASDSEILNAFEKVFLKAVQKRIPSLPFGILFSGGIDSVLLACACIRLGHKPKLLHTAISIENKPSADLAFAKLAAKHLKLPLLIACPNLEESATELSDVVSIIESSDVTKAGVGLTTHLSAQTAKKHNLKVVLSGLGADELFAGYSRQQQFTQNLNAECRSYLRKAFEKDLYRDDTLCMSNTVELRVPYYDRELIPFGLGLPDDQKIFGQQRKRILRRLAEKWELPNALALRAKKASQYASNADHAIQLLAKQNRFPTKSQYLWSLWKKPMLRLGCLISGGKDSWLASQIMNERNYRLQCLVSLQSQNPDSYLFHTPNISLVRLQAKAARKPLVLVKTTGKKETEINDLKKALRQAIQKHQIDAIVTGALYSAYQRDRIEEACEELGLKVFHPLWHVNQENELRELLAKKYEVAFSSVAAQGLNRNWLGSRLDTGKIAELARLHKKFGLNEAGEGGEYESVVLDCPLFTRKIRIQKSEISMQNDCTGQWKIQKAKLVPKPVPQAPRSASS